MHRKIINKLSAFHIFESLQDGLSHFSGPSRVAIIYAVRQQDPLYIYDPQQLLRGHEPKLKELFLDSEDWRRRPPAYRRMGLFSQPAPEPNLHLTGLISTGGKSRSMAYQMWFTEHHPDMCSIGPTERWLERAIWLLSQDVSREESDYNSSSGYVIREYAPHAVRDYIIDELNRVMGMDIQLRIYGVIDAVLGISKTVEEGAWPRGELTFVEPGSIPGMTFLAEFPRYERPSLQSHKHVRKLLQAVESSSNRLVSDGEHIIGVASQSLPENCLAADFKGRYGFLKLNDSLVCSFSDGSFHSSTRKDKLVQLEEFLIDIPLAEPSASSELFKIASYLVHQAEEKKFGCTLVIDMNEKPVGIGGQHLEKALDLREPALLELATSLARLDGALHIGKDMHLHGFACILDGLSVPGEDRSRGARFNSALRFTARHDHVIVVVVSSDRPVSVIQEGVELSARCDWTPISARLPSPPRLVDWIKG